jgi:hypothetical protein
MNRFKVSVCPREQQRAFELAEDSGGDNFRIVGFHTETLKPTLDCVLPVPAENLIRAMAFIQRLEHN